VIGRVRWGWTDGSWNEWLLLFNDGSHGWLGEAMGQYMLTRERPIGDIQANVPRAIIAGENVPVGTETEMDGDPFVVADARDATCIASEGELPFTAEPAGPSSASTSARPPAAAPASSARRACRASTTAATSPSPSSHRAD
jgi:hypothetical protein